MPNNNILEQPNAYGRRIPKIGDVYVHFKGMRVIIENIATHTETKEILVIYRHGDNVWARPLEMFLSKVDTEKYPDATQVYRLEKELPWDIKNTFDFKQVFEELSKSKEFQDYTTKQLESYVLEHYFLWK